MKYFGVFVIMALCTEVRVAKAVSLWTETVVKIEIIFRHFHQRVFQKGFKGI